MNAFEKLMSIGTIPSDYKKECYLSGKKIPARPDVDFDNSILEIVDDSIAELEELGTLTANDAIKLLNLYPDYTLYDWTETCWDYSERLKNVINDSIGWAPYDLFETMDLTDAAVDLINTYFADNYEIKRSNLLDERVYIAVQEILLSIRNYHQEGDVKPVKASLTKVIEGDQSLSRRDKRIFLIGVYRIIEIKENVDLRYKIGFTEEVKLNIKYMLDPIYDNNINISDTERSLYEQFLEI